MVAEDIDISQQCLEQQYNLHTDENQSANSNDTPPPIALHNRFNIEHSSRNRYLSRDPTTFWGVDFEKFKSSITNWFYQSAWPGLGLFGESYMLFSIGLLKPIWEEIYPECFNYQDMCTPFLLKSLTISVVMGVISGMIIVGYLANFMGRRFGSILTASLMSSSAIGLALVSTFLSHSPVWLYRFMSIFLFIFGLGVGGEYPLSASSASERAMQHHLKQNQIKATEELDKDAHHVDKKGRKVNTSSHPDTGGGSAIADDVIAYRQEVAVTPPPKHDDGIPNHNLEALSDLHSVLVEKETDDVGGECRGSQVQMVFAMQGLGIWFNSIVLLFLLLVMGQTGKDGNYNHSVLLIIWNICYLIGAAILVVVLITRVVYLEESKVWADDKQRRDQQQQARSNVEEQGSSVIERKVTAALTTEHDMPMPSIETNCSSVSSLSNPTLAMHHEYDEQIIKPVPSTEPEEDRRSSPTYLLFRNFGVRLFGASMSWLLWDISFYGNKLFQSSFLLALTGEDTTLLEFMAAAALNSTVSLLGYYAAAALVDNPNFGRLRLQAGGFLICGLLFLICGFTSEQLSTGSLVVLYLASGFFGQLGPNATTFLIPAEVFPTEMRTLCHGICAASGKVGALIAAVMFNFLKHDADLFLLSGYSSFLGCLITIWTIPEVSKLNILEIDRKWRMTLDGRKKDYSGDANHPNNLSMYERWKLGLQY